MGPVADSQCPLPRRRRAAAALGVAGVSLVGVVACSWTAGGPSAPIPELYGPRSAEPASRAAALVARMTLSEKVSQLRSESPAIPRLGIPAYDWWSESLHGVARAGVATVFPQAIALGATFDDELVRRVAEAIAEEARAKFEAAGGGAAGTKRYRGLTFFAPNVNIFRDPRWGRGQETYGEDPFLTARMGVAYVRGLQEPAGEPGNGRRALRVAAVGKHFAVHSGPEVTRHRFDARVSAHDLGDTYLPQFEALVREAHPSGIMAAYNRVNGEAAVASPFLLGTTLRGRWGFDGFVVGDCGAVADVAGGHGLAADATHAAAMALRAGTNLDCGETYDRLADAVADGLVTEAEIDRAAVRLFAVRFRLGLFDPSSSSSPSSSSRGPGGMPADFPPASHRALALEAARKSLVLLENDGTLPVAPGVRRIAVVGPTADDLDVLVGSYHGDPARPVTPLAGIRAAAFSRGIAVTYARGVTLAGRSRAEIDDAVRAAARADLVVAVLGLSPRLEGEEGDPDSDNASGDRRDLSLPGQQAALLRAILGTGRPTVVVLTGGGAIALPETSRPVNAALMAWYSGEAGGDAIADVLFGVVAPSGRLPVTFYRSVADLPPFADYAMAGRTYRYFTGRAAYPFGYGLGYARVSYGDVAVVVSGTSPGGAVARVALRNEGARALDEVVPIYATPRPRLPGDPLRSLVAFRRVSLAAGKRRRLEVPLGPAAFTRVGTDGVRRPVTGTWDVAVGAAPPVTVDLSAAPPAAPSVAPASSAAAPPTDAATE